MLLPVLGCGGHTKHGGLPYVPPVSFTQSLWVANGTNVLEFLPTQLAGGVSDVAPHLTLESTSLGAPQGVVFDAKGDLWVVDAGSAFGGATAPGIREFTATQLADLKNSTFQNPTRSIGFQGFSVPQQAAFDQSGDLWVSDSGASLVYEFTPSQLSGSGTNVTPRLQLAANPDFSGPIGITFSAAGDMWIANNGGTSLFSFEAKNLAVSGSVTLIPNVILSDDGNNSIQQPWALAFDASGNLWSDNAGTLSTLVEFRASDLTSSGSPTPALTITSNTDGGFATLLVPNGLAFDTGGNLAVVDSAAANAAGNYAFVVFGASQLKDGGAPQPAVLLGGSASALSVPAGAVFGPVVN
jgi:sugar lactone lactonase YvrE